MNQIDDHDDERMHSKWRLAEGMCWCASAQFNLLLMFVLEQNIATDTLAVHVCEPSWNLQTKKCWRQRLFITQIFKNCSCRPPFATQQKSLLFDRRRWQTKLQIHFFFSITMTCDVKETSQLAGLVEGYTFRLMGNGMRLAHASHKLFETVSSDNGMINGRIWRHRIENTIVIRELWWETEMLL